MKVVLRVIILFEQKLNIIQTAGWMFFLPVYFLSCCFATTVNESKTFCHHFCTVPLLLKWLLWDQCSPWTEGDCKRSQQGNERIAWAKEATFLYSAICLEIELQGHITVSHSYPCLLGLCPHTWQKMAFYLCVCVFQHSECKKTKNTQCKVLHINMIYHKCGIFYKLYNCLHFMAGSVCNGDKQKRAGVSSKHSRLQHTVISQL